MLQWLRLIVLTLLACVLPAHVCAEPLVEVVETAPVETDLQVAGLRETPRVWVEMIEGAKKTIDLEQFYVYSKEGEALDPVLKALRAAAERGVSIRLIVESKFYSKYPDDPDALDKVPNISVKQIDFSVTGGIQHAKYFIVDGHDTFVGSANFDWVALTHVHELGLRIQDNSVASKLQAIFDRDWKRAMPLHDTEERTEGTTAFDTDARPSDTSDITLVASPDGQLPINVPSTLNTIVSMLDNAKKSIQVQVYEYATKNFRSSTHWYLLDRALRDAASRGVKVQLLVDKTSLRDGRPDLVALNGVDNVDVKVVTIPQWSGGEIPYARLIHSKYMIVDRQTAWLGTENWQGNYFTSSRNVGVIVRRPEVVKALGQVFERLWNSSYTSAP